MDLSKLERKIRLFHKSGFNREPSEIITTNRNDEVELRFQDKNDSNRELRITITIKSDIANWREDEECWEREFTKARKDSSAEVRYLEEQLREFRDREHERIGEMTG